MLAIGTRNEALRRCSRPNARVARAAHDELARGVQAEHWGRVPAQHVRAVPTAAVGARLEHADAAVAAREVQPPAPPLQRHQLREVHAAPVALAAAARRRVCARRRLQLRQVQLLSPPLAAFQTRRAALRAAFNRDYLTYVLISSVHKVWITVSESGVRSRCVAIVKSCTHNLITYSKSSRFTVIRAIL